MKRGILAGIIALGTLQPLYAWFQAANGGQAGDNLFSYGCGAAATALGMTPVACSGKAALLSVNPASLAGVWWQEAAFTMTPLFGQAQFTAVSYAFPLDETQAFGAALLHLDSGEAELTTELGETVGTFSDRETALVLGYARHVQAALECGAAVKFLLQDIDTYAGRACSADAGVVYHAAPTMQWGLSVRNLLPARMGPDILPCVPYAGCRKEFFGRKLAANAELGFPGIFGAATAARWSCGVEYAGIDWLRCRAGLNNKQVAAGFGLTTRQVDFDYALIYHPLDVLHTVSLTIRYGFSPTAEERQVAAAREELARAQRLFAEEQQRAAEQFRVAAEAARHTADNSARFLKAQNAYGAKNYAAARQQLEELLSRDPEHAAARELLAELIAREDTTQVAARLEEGYRAYRQGNYADALRAVAFVQQAQPGNQKAAVLGFLARAQELIQAKKFSDAKGVLIEIMKIEPAHEEAGVLLKRLQTILDMMVDQKE